MNISLSSSKRGYGLSQLLSSSHSEYWSTDGPLPHGIKIEFPYRTYVYSISLSLDFERDDSYTPQRLRIVCNSTSKEMTLNEPVGEVEMAVNELVLCIHIVILSNHSEDYSDGLTITIYKRPAEDREYRIELVKEKVLITPASGSEQHIKCLETNGAFAIELPGEVELSKVASDKYKIQVELVKKVRGRWNNIDEFCRKAASSKNTEANTSDTPDCSQGESATDPNNRTHGNDDSHNPDDLFALLQNIYSQGDENIRKAMNKSLRESNGTVLSTDWESVKNNKPQNE